MLQLTLRKRRDGRIEIKIRFHKRSEISAPSKHNLITAVSSSNDCYYFSTKSKALHIKFGRQNSKNNNKTAGKKVNVKTSKYRMCTVISNIKITCRN